MKTPNDETIGSKGRKTNKAAKESNRRKYGSTPKLTCILTGQTRTTNMDYLEAKAERLGCTVEDVVENYISREGLARLKAGKTVEEIREEFKSEGPRIAKKRLPELVRFNARTASVKEEKEAVAA